MQPVHIDPKEAVQMHQELKCKKSIGIHWGKHIFSFNEILGTYKLTTEPMDEPPQLVAKELSERGLKADEFIVTKIGEVVVLKESSKDLQEENLD